ncbi:TlpA disulfide reductase family protein [Actinoplanes sp. NPDC051494]|uniref:TlpA disulfide reductase family protein n=1 Tax=Actinoplanes sp. NPDC051494 TaxID=3363907 RepID=UPI0037935C0C
MTRTPRVGVWLTPPLALLLAACTSAEMTPASSDDQPSPFADCTTLTTPLTPSPTAASPSAAALPSAAYSAAAPSSAPPPSVTPPSAGPLLSASAGPSGAALSPAPPSTAPDIPDLSLPCFTGGAAVRTTDLRGPAVINLWGSWCGPCREELPIMQELADATTGRLRVLGVDTRDSRDAGASFAADHGVSIPTLYDPEQKLLAGLGKATLPVTVFLDADGKRFVYTGQALDKPTLGPLVRTHTGVTVSP